MEKSCHQFNIRKKNLNLDLKQAGLTREQAQKLRVKDFKFSFVPARDKKTCKKIKEFIIRHEWLGTMPHRPTHRFIATYEGAIAGVIIMSTPNAFSHLLGAENKNLEKLISRGACISWSPKNLASHMIKRSIDWMIKNTPFLFFTAYSDPRAGEIGTIYQACGFTYLGQTSGTRYKYLDKNKGWVTDRSFRRVSSYKDYATKLEISWQGGWSLRSRMLWENIPDDLEKKIRSMSRLHQKSCERKRCTPKHKYVFVKGKSHSENKKLFVKLHKHNPKLNYLTYPKRRSL